MELFISWSKSVSQQIADELRNWLPLILNDTKTYMTAADIDKGAKWQNEINTKLEQCDYGLVCLTRENLSSQWIAFEAGALSKKLSGRVATIRFGVEQAEVGWPLAMFQSTAFNETDFRQLVNNINKSLPNESQRTEVQLEKLFPKLWPEFEKTVRLILESAAAAQPAQAAPSPDYPAVVTELLTLARSQATALSSLPERIMKIEQTANLTADALLARIERLVDAGYIRSARMRTGAAAHRVLEWARSAASEGGSAESVILEARKRWDDLCGEPCAIYCDGDTMTIKTPIDNWSGPVAFSAKPPVRLVVRNPKSEN